MELQQFDSEEDEDEYESDKEMRHNQQENGSENNGGNIRPSGPHAGPRSLITGSTCRLEDDANIMSCPNWIFPCSSYHPDRPVRLDQFLFAGMETPRLGAACFYGRVSNLPF